MKKNAFTLIEVLVFTAILNLFFVAVIAVSLASLRNMKFNEHKIMAVKYAEELESWLRSEKDIEWTSFIANYTDNIDGKTYCFNVSPIDVWPSEGACSSDSLTPPIYKREVVLINNGVGASPPTNTQVSITVKWNELGSVSTVPVKTVLSLFER